MSPKAKHVLARDHLDLAREEIEENHRGVAVTLLLHAAEAAIDAQVLNRERKGFAYDGDEPEFSGETIEHVAARVEALVVAAEEAWSGA